MLPVPKRQGSPSGESDGAQFGDAADVGHESKAEETASGVVQTYEAFRTGLTFGQVRQMLWVQSSDPKDWRHKRRNTVLGLWRQIKLEMWREYCAWRDSYDDTRGTA